MLGLLRLLRCKAAARLAGAVELPVEEAKCAPVMTSLRALASEVIE
jgi:hypothetical protein